MKWIRLTKGNERQELPRDKQFFCLWKGQFGLSEFDEEENCFYLCFLPAQMSGMMKVDRDREGKFTHYCIPDYPEDY